MGRSRQRLDGRGATVRRALSRELAIQFDLPFRGAGGMRPRHRPCAGALGRKCAMIWVWTSLLALTSVLAEVLVGNWLFAIPFVAVTAFYFTVLLDWRSMATVFLFAALLGDFLWGRALPLTAFSLPVVVQIAHFWRQHGHCRQVAVQSLPGGLVGIGASALWIVFGALPAERLSSDLVWFSLRTIIAAAVGSAILLPCMCWLLDTCAHVMGFPQYRSSQERNDRDVA